MTKLVDVGANDDEDLLLILTRFITFSDEVGFHLSSPIFLVTMSVLL